MDDAKALKAEWVKLGFEVQLFDSQPQPQYERTKGEPDNHGRFERSGIDPLSDSRVRAEACFLAALDRIEAAQGLPSPWDAQCLVTALKEIAVENWVMARKAIERSNTPRRMRTHGNQGLSTVPSLRSALSTVHELSDIKGAWS